ncbi:MAG: hypothetical protein P1P88_05440 [Bacteroidales bacterium]|nr:hypothetical protein [Bacteroidales bacterium]
MNEDKAISEKILIEIAYLFKPLKQLSNDVSVYKFFNKIGYKLPASNLFQNGFSDFVSDITSLLSKVKTIKQSIDSESYLDLVLELKESIESIISFIGKSDGIRREIQNELNSYPEFINNSGINTPIFPKRLMDFLIYEYFKSRQIRIFSFLHLFGLVENEERMALYDWEPAEINQKYSLKKVVWERVPQFIMEPSKIADEIYTWNTDFDGEEFIKRLEILLKAFLIPGGIYKQNDKVREYYNRELGAKEIRIPLLQEGNWPDSYMEFDLNIFDIPEIVKNGITLKHGLGFYPSVYGEISKGINLGNDWTLSFKVDLDLEGGIGIQLRPSSIVRMDTSIFSNPEDFNNSHLELSISKLSTINQLNLIFGSQNGSCLGYKDFGFNFEIGLKNGEYTFAFETFINALTLIIDGSKGDGFIQKILSGVKIESISDLVIGISSTEGFYFGGSSELSIVIPIHKKLGPIFIDSVTIGICFEDGIRILLASSFTAQIGPVSGTVKEIGLEIPIGFPENRDGNLGPINLESILFRPPLGVGLAINTAGLAGGGYIEFDPTNKRYAGIVALKFGSYTLTGIGLIDTIMPDGSKNFSLMINIGVVFNPSIQLAFGFSLAGVGGLLGANRTANSEALRAGLRAQTLDSILFPEDPIANATKIISDMRAVFNPKEGRFIIAPMVKIAWGEGIISADICILLELFEPLRIMLLGQLNVSLPMRLPPGSAPPSDIYPLVEINLDVLGILDFGKKELSIDASLYNSRILILSLYGDAALRLRWGSNPMFAMSLGGFHPKFKPPAGFPSLRRITISLADTKHLKLTCTTYFALTSNSVQFGCGVELFAGYSGAELTGHLSFDALFYFSPFSFVVSMSAGIGIAYKGYNLASIDLYLELSGPTPWRAVGTATFSILCWDVDVDFEVEWGSDKKVSLPGKDPLEYLITDLNNNSSWGVVFLGITNYESFKTNEKDSDLILWHPAGLPEIRQKTVPFNFEVTKYANAPIKDHDKFYIEKNSNEKSIIKLQAIRIVGDSVVQLGITSEIPFRYTTEEFAMGQYLNYSNTDKLKKPSFEPLDAVLYCDVDIMLLPIEEPHAQELVYENILIDSERVSKRDSQMRTIPWRLTKRAMLRDRIHTSGLAPGNQFAMDVQSSLVRVKNEGYGVVDSSNGAFTELGDRFTTIQSVEEYVTDYLEQKPGIGHEIEILAEFELEPFLL